MFNECIARTGRVVVLSAAASTREARIEFVVDRTTQAAVHILEGALTDLPAANPKKEANDIALLLLRKLLEVLQGTHFACAIRQVSTSSPANRTMRKIDLMETEQVTRCRREKWDIRTSLEFLLLVRSRESVEFVRVERHKISGPLRLWKSESPNRRAKPLDLIRASVAGPSSTALSSTTSLGTVPHRAPSSSSLQSD
jgi:hypothetical protein